MALGAGDVLFFCVDPVAGGIEYLYPFHVTTFVAFLALFIGDVGMFPGLVRAVDHVAYYQLRAPDGAHLVAVVAVYFLMLASLPAGPRLFHSVAGPAKVGVVLRIVIDLTSAIQYTSYYNGDPDCAGDS